MKRLGLFVHTMQTPNALFRGGAEEEYLPQNPRAAAVRIAQGRTGHGEFPHPNKNYR